jgi:hypothetical protein
MGVKFVPVSEALSDDAYQLPDDVIDLEGHTFFEKINLPTVTNPNNPKLDQVVAELTRLCAEP